MIIEEEPRCPECRVVTWPCFGCQRQTYCGACGVCHNNNCPTRQRIEHVEESQRLVGFDFSTSSLLYPPVVSKQQQWLEWNKWGLSYEPSSIEMSEEVVEDKKQKKPKETLKRRFTEDEFVSTKKRKIVKAGKGGTGKLNQNTDKPPPLSIGVGTWNLNHINDAEKKLSTLLWLFDRHLWLDALALQEVNLKGKVELLKQTFLEGLGSRGLECRFGPLMRSISTSGPQVDVNEETDDEETDDEDDSDEDDGDEDVSEKVNEDKVRTEQWTILGKQVDVKVSGSGDRTRLHAVNVDMGWFTQWMNVRPGQPEYYPAIVRSRMFMPEKKTDAWASYDGERLEPDIHFWAKKPCTVKLFELPCRGDKATKEWKGIAKKLPVKKPKKAVELPEALVKALEEEGGLKDPPTTVGYVRSGKSSVRSKGSPWVRKWMFSFADKPGVHMIVVQMKHRDDCDTTAKIYEKSLSQLDVRARGQLVVYLQASFWPSYCRPVIVHDLTLCQFTGYKKIEGEKISLGIVHTTPAGHGLKRQGEYDQLKDMFAYVGKAGGHWVLAGDYYLDPQSTVVQSTILNHNREQLFETHLAKANLDLAISVSATNQTRLKGKAQNIFDRTSRLIQREGKEITVVVLNKRADFFACSKTFVFRQTGIVAPNGGLLPLDFDHRALNWWSDISDHCPVAGLLCTHETPEGWRRFEIQKLPKDFREKIDVACKQVEDLHRLAVKELSAALAVLCNMVGQRGDKTNDWTACLRKYCVLLSCVLGDPDLAQFGPEVPDMDYAALAEASKEVTKEALLEWLAWNHAAVAPTDERMIKYLRARLAKDPIDGALRGALSIYDELPIEDVQEMMNGTKAIPEDLDDEALRKLGQGWIERIEASKTETSVKKRLKALNKFDPLLRSYLIKCWVAREPVGFEQMVEDEHMMCDHVHRANRHLHVLNYVLGDVDLQDEDETYKEVLPFLGKEDEEETNFQPIPYVEVGNYEVELGLRIEEEKKKKEEDKTDTDMGGEGKV